MLVGGITLDPNWFFQLILTLFVIALGVLHVVKNTASKYFEVEANFDHRDHRPISTTAMDSDRLSCTNCGKNATKRCAGCKSVRYCSGGCQQEHWRSGHRSQCKTKISSTTVKATSHSGISLIPCSGTSTVVKKPRKILFPYEEFVDLFNWDKARFVPCGLLNCGNSCYANVVLQCLTTTRPLVAYLLEKGHRRDCRRNDWCFLCELQIHVERAQQSVQPFSPINILSRLPNIGGNLGYGRQEDAHEFMRFAIDTMQSVCLDEFGGEKAVDPFSQETTLIQHIFGGHLQSQVMCTKCNKISNQYENMMDLTVEIHGDASSLEECLDQFTMKEWLHGDNMYRCDGCNDYVKAWKRLTVRQAPNILTIALKRFQSGRFGKLNKKVSFPETFNLTPYMSEENDAINEYRLYAVVVHVDMLNASFFGHYICYIKDIDGNWYRIDDCKVKIVELEEVLLQPAYMILYSRVVARPTSFRTAESHGKGNDKSIRVSSEPGASLQDGTMNCISAGDSLHHDNLKAARKDRGNNEMGDSAMVKQDSEAMDMDADTLSSTDFKGASRCDNNPSVVDSSVPVSETPDNEQTIKEDSHMAELPREQDPEEMNVDADTLSSTDFKGVSNGDSNTSAAVPVSGTLENERTSWEDSHVAAGFVTAELPTNSESRTPRATDVAV